MSNDSPLTGSNRSPTRHSTLAIPSSAAFRRASATARSLMSVATTRSHFCASTSATVPRAAAEVERASRAARRPRHARQTLRAALRP